MKFVKNLVDAILNKDDTYPGNLEHYFAVLLLRSSNMMRPYHNLTHTNHVAWHGYRAAMYYLENEIITPREVRTLMIALMLHDANHTGHLMKDSDQIEAALDFLRTYILPEDKEYFEEIAGIIRRSEFPSPNDLPEPTLLQQIMCDIDLTQVLCLTWMQQVLFGLGSEMGKGVREMLQMQEPFLQKYLKFKTEWAKIEFPQKLIDAKMEQIRELLKIIENHEHTLNRMELATFAKRS